MGHREHRDRAPRSIATAILTVSDTRTATTDEGGALIQHLCEAAGHRVIERRLVPDDQAQIRRAVEELASLPDAQAVLVTGGTGVSPRDRTFEAVVDLLDVRLDGFGELFRALSFQQIGSAAMLSRAVAGLRSGVPVFVMPGSPPAVRLAMEALILPELGHIVAEAAKGV